MSSPTSSSPPSGRDPLSRRERYAPFSPQAIALFREAAKLVGCPEEWAEDPGLHQILRRESDGYVGRPNYRYGVRATDPSQWPLVHQDLRAGLQTSETFTLNGKQVHSSATGLGQLTLPNVDLYYPSKRNGIGVALEEAAGMLRYIRDRYGGPAAAWAQYGAHGEGY